MSGHFHVPVALTPRKTPLITTEYEAGWAPQPVGTFRSTDNYAALSDINLCFIHPIACALYSLSCPGSHLARVKPGTHYTHVTWAHIKLTFYFQLLPFPCIGSHMPISVIWWLGVI